MNRCSLLASPFLFVLLSLLVGVASFSDTAARLAFFYTSNQTYPLSAYLKPIFFLTQLALFLLFLREVRFSRWASFLDKRTRTLLDWQLLLVTIAAMLYIDGVVGGIAGIALPRMLTDGGWLLLFALGLTTTAFYTAAMNLKEGRVNVAAVFFIVGIAFLLKPFEGFYFWVQTYAGFVLPYFVVWLGMFAPHLLMTLALIAAILVIHLRAPNSGVLSSILRTPAVYAASVTALIPLTLEGIKEGLPNTIARAVVYWGLGYTGFDSYSVSIYLFSLVMYIYVIRKLISKLGDSPGSALVLLGFASFPWNGLMIMLFGYSSIPGNLLSLDAVAVGLILRRNNQKTGEIA